MTGLTLRDPWKSYGAVKLIKGVNLNITPGEFVVFAGHRGTAWSSRWVHR
jgi:ABC-type sugar transport system ATPase subunit